MKRFSRTLKIVFKKLFKLYIIGAIILFIIFAATELIPNAGSLETFVMSMGVGILFSLFASFFIISFFLGPWISYYVMFKIGSDVVDTMEESECKSIDNNVYYRDIPQGYNPAIASLILNKWFEKKTDMTAMTLYLIKKGYLKKEGNDIVYTGKDMSDLPQSERYIVEGHANNNATFNYEGWKDIVVQEAKDKGYVESLGEFSKIEVTRKVQTYAFIIAACFIISSILGDEILGFVLFALLSMFVPFIIIIVIIFAFRRARIQVKLTQKGIEEQEKLVKLRKFLEDFSSLEKSNDEAVVLWEDYLIYAISLGVNTDIVEKSNMYKQLNYGTYTVNQQLAYDLARKYTSY